MPMPNTSMRSAFVRLACYLVAFLTIAIGAQAVVAGQAAVGRIEGVVVDRATSQPIPGATITVVGAEIGAAAGVASDRNGRFAVPVTRTGSASVRVEAPGYVRTEQPDVPIGGAPLRVELERTPNFLERVQVTATKEPLRPSATSPAQTDIVERSTIDDPRRSDADAGHRARARRRRQRRRSASFESVMLRGMPRDDNEFTNTLLLDRRRAAGRLAQQCTRRRRCRSTMPAASKSCAGPTPRCTGAPRSADRSTSSLPIRRPRRSSRRLTGGEFATQRRSPLSRAAQRSGAVTTCRRKRNTARLLQLEHADFGSTSAALFGKLTFAPDSKSFGSVSVNRVVSDDSTPTNEPIVDGQLLARLDPQFDRLSSFNLPVRTTTRAKRA